MLEELQGLKRGQTQSAGQIKLIVLFCNQESFLSQERDIIGMKNRRSQRTLENQDPWIREMLKSQKTRKPRTIRPYEDRKDPAVLFLATKVFAHTDEFCKFLEDASMDGDTLKNVPYPGREVFFDFYQHHRHFFTPLLTKMLPIIVKKSFVGDVFSESLKGQFFNTKDEISFWAKNDLMPALSARLKKEFEDVKTFLRSPKREPKEDLSNLDPFSDILIFLCLIVLPCFFYYRTNPWTLYHKARRGDIKAICKLVRLEIRFPEVSVLDDKRIAGYVETLLSPDCEENSKKSKHGKRSDVEGELKIKKRDRNMLKRALDSKGFRKLDNAEVKRTFAAFMQMFIESINYLNSKEFSFNLRRFIDGRNGRALSPQESGIVKIQFAQNDKVQLKPQDIHNIFNDIAVKKKKKKGSKDRNLDKTDGTFRKDIDRERDRFENPDSLKP